MVTCLVSCGWLVANNLVPHFSVDVPVQGLFRRLPGQESQIDSRRKPNKEAGERERERSKAWDSLTVVPCHSYFYDVALAFGALCALILGIVSAVAWYGVATSQ